MIQSLGKSEALRQKALEQYQLPGTRPDHDLEDMTQLAADICGTTMAGISLIGDDSITFETRVGPGPQRVPRGRMPCERCVAEDTVYEVTDARYHPDFRPDGILLGGRTIRFYAGAPITTAEGVSIGCLFVQATMPMALNGKQKFALASLARQVMARIELNSRARSMEKDFHSRHRAESALMVERNFVSTVLDTVGALVAVYDTAGRVVRFNRTCEEVSGYAFTTLVGRFMWEASIPEDEVPDAVADFERLRSGDFPARFENNWQHHDGSLRRISWSATALVDNQGRPNFIIATGIDITEQRAAEVTLRESEARYRQLIEGSLGMVCTHALDGTILSVNAHGAESLGHTPGEMVGQSMAAFMLPQAHAAFGDYLKQIIATGEAQGRMKLIRSGGAVRVVAFGNKLIRVADRPAYVLGFGVDITEQVHAEEKLRVLTHQSDSILESVGDGIYGVDLDGLVTVINPAAALMLGYKPNELLGQNIHQMVHHTHADGAPYPEEDCAIFSTVRNLDTVRVSNEIFWRKDGTSFPVEYVARPQVDSSEGRGIEKAVGVVVAFRDTTERRALERMKDEFISTVSHELRTPLTSLRAALGLLSGGALARRPDKQQQMLEIAVGNTDRLIRLVNDFLDIERISSGNAELHSQICSAQGLIERAVSLQQAAADKNNLRFSIQAQTIDVFADPDRILQALTNLISNAIKFSPPNATISLSAYRSAGLDEQHEALFTIHDEGRGIPSDKLETIFERFQQVDASDSRAMGGTGLGLAICRSIINQHGGRIWAFSPPGKGTTFHFTLPTRPSSHLS